MTELILIRHGQTELNRGPFFQGQIDVPLNALGLAQAARLARRLAGERIDAIACSDLLRTRQTAAPASRSLDLAPAHDAALREQSFGAFEGLSFDQVTERHPEAFAAWLRHEAGYAVPGGESVVRFHARVVGALRAIARANAGRRIAVVTHGGVLDMAWRTARGLGLDGARSCPIPNAGLNLLRVEGDAFEILAWADDAHVADLGPAPGPPPTSGDEDEPGPVQPFTAASSPSAR
jgi:probable phosphoglycerate mutase